MADHREYLTPAKAQALLAASGHAWWKTWNRAELDRTCAVVQPRDLHQWPDLARWRALCGFMQERADAFDCLELAHTGHAAAGDVRAAEVDAHIALMLCLIDGGAMHDITRWLGRARGLDLDLPAQKSGDDFFWLCAGTVARVVLGDPPSPRSEGATDWMHQQLQPLRSVLSNDERLIVAQILINLHLALGNFEQFDLIASAVSEPAAFAAASVLMRGRWMHTLGLAHYHVGNIERAEMLWQGAMTLARAEQLRQLQLMSSLSMLRLLIDKGRQAEAKELEASIEPSWGAGRDIQLMYLRQMGARLLMLRGMPARALANLQEALVLADKIGLSSPERASCMTDLAQVLVANQRAGEAADLLTRLADESTARDRSVFLSLLYLLNAWRERTEDGEASRRLLAAGLHVAQEVRYTMFFRLMPTLAAELCALALQWDIERTLVLEVICARRLPAPAGADKRWPWVLYLSMLGSLGLRAQGGAAGELHKPGRKTQRKPLELLCALACADDLALSMAEAEDALWPDAEGDLARKSLEMTVQRLRRLLDDRDNSLVLVTDGRVGLNRQHVSSDLSQLRTMAGQLEAFALAAAPVRSIIEVVQRIRELGDGPLLAGVAEVPWLERERQRFARDRARAERLILAAAARPEVTPAERAWLERASSVAPA